jgi:hypothetical protein
MIIFELPDSDAKLLILFRQYQDRFGDMIASGMFELREASATVHFGKEGEISLIDKHTYYRPIKIK